MFVACIGTFDGVHAGHRKIIDEAVNLSKNLKANSIAISMIYPWQYYFPNFPGLIYPVSQRIELILDTGIEDVITVNMAEIKDIEPEDYISSLLSQGLKGLVVGEDFTFGKNARGDVKMLSRMAADYGFELKTIPKQTYQSKRISSSWIREAIARGDIKLAGKLLQRPYHIFGQVYRDQGLGGKLGFPTANISRGEDKLVHPRSGVYIVRSIIDNETVFGLLNVGFRPTINPSEEVKYEVYYLDFEKELYSKVIEMDLLEYLRPELKFNTLDDLIKAIKRDERIARAWIAKHLSNQGEKEIENF
ncbi:riboflavin biosynthesis protein RibF [Kosmotoga arenicorallina S304]|uniref:Riboflavin biosynthesis protein n=1 Tax=Kosmotoga arenicorallina S304 TaxID=1453497 RepID=A0A176K0N0_9BACT|nr:riboflavin biosynthesis protein RibF [Kosmotoga arenicorallina]OAA29735.1 riboflavin biosynthesis protein RibF [Kosmotoga arenicorallina S304]